MASEMMEALMALCQEKHIDELYLIDQLEQSLAKSYAEVMHLQDGARVTIDRETGKVYVYKLVPKEESWDDETGLYTDFDEVDVTPKDTNIVTMYDFEVDRGGRLACRHVGRFGFYLLLDGLLLLRGNRLLALSLPRRSHALAVGRPRTHKKPDARSKKNGCDGKHRKHGNWYG